MFNCIIILCRFFQFWVKRHSSNYLFFLFHVQVAHTFNGPLSGTTQVSRYQKGKTNLDSTEARDSEWQWHQLGHMQVCTLLQTDNHSSTPPLSFLQAGCPSCHPTNSVRALKACSSSSAVIIVVVWCFISVHTHLTALFPILPER